MIFKELLTNEQIVASEVRLIGAEGEQLGILPLNSAMQKAHDDGFDLVLLNAVAKPVVCKIMDYGKYKFDTIKKEKELKKNQKIVDLKEVQLSLTIDTHDIEVKAKHANRFLLDGDKVKISLRMKGRQQAFSKNAVKVVTDFAERLAENGIVDKPAEINGKNIILIVAPKNNK